MVSAQAAWPIPATASRSTVLRRAIPYCLVAVVTALYLFPFVRTLSGSPDDGIYLYAGQRVAEGAIPGRDFVQENAPGAYYWLAGFFRAFGISLITARAVLFITGLATILIVFYLARRAGSTGWHSAIFVLITSIPLMPINSPHYDSNLFALAAFAILLQGFDSLSQGNSPWWHFAVAGLLTGWVSCILQQKGFLFLLAFCISAVAVHKARGLRPVILMVISYASVIAALLGLYLVKGALYDLYFSFVKLPLTTYHGLTRVTYGFPLWTVWFPTLYAEFRKAGPILVALPLLLEISLPLLCIIGIPALIAALGWVWRSVAFSKELLPYWICAYAMWISEIHRQDLSHLRNGCVLLMILLFVLCERFGKWPAKTFVMAVVVGTVLLASTNLFTALRARQIVASRRGNLPSEKKFPLLDELIARTRPGDYAFVYPYSPAYYFLADVQNPTRFSVIVDQNKANPLMPELVRDLDKNRPRYALVDTTLLGDGLRKLFPAFHAPAPQDRVVDCYIAAHYHPVMSDSGFELLERNARR